MALSRLDQKKFPFFREASSAGNSDIFGNNGYDSLTLEVSGATGVSLKVQGCINLEDANKNPIPDANLQWSDLAVINMKNFNVGSSISENGIYAIGVNGLAKIRVVLESVTGSVTVIGTLEA